MTQKFPARTLVLMMLTLAAFAWFWFQTQKARSSLRSPLSVIMVRPDPADAGPAQ